MKKMAMAKAMKAMKAVRTSTPTCLCCAFRFRFLLFYSRCEILHPSVIAYELLFVSQMQLYYYVTLFVADTTASGRRAQHRTFK